MEKPGASSARGSAASCRRSSEAKCNAKGLAFAPKNAADLEVWLLGGLRQMVVSFCNLEQIGLKVFFLRPRGKLAGSYRLLTVIFWLCARLSTPLGGDHGRATTRARGTQQAGRRVSGEPLGDAKQNVRTGSPFLCPLADVWRTAAPIAPGARSASDSQWPRDIGISPASNGKTVVGALYSRSSWRL